MHATWGNRERNLRRRVMSRYFLLMMTNLLSFSSLSTSGWVYQEEDISPMKSYASLLIPVSMMIPWLTSLKNLIWGNFIREISLYGNKVKPYLSCDLLVFVLLLPSLIVWCLLLDQETSKRIYERKTHWKFDLSVQFIGFMMKINEITGLVFDVLLTVFFTHDHNSIVTHIKCVVLLLMNSLCTFLWLQHKSPEQRLTWFFLSQKGISTWYFVSNLGQGHR